VKRENFTLTNYVPLLLAVLGAIVLSLESYLTLYGKSLCKTDGCQIVSNYISISEPLLITFGAVFFWILSALFFFSNRNPDKLQPFVIVLLLLTLAFDGTLIGFQVFTIQQTCVICFATATVLILIALFYFIQQRLYTLLLCSIFIWLGTFGANSILVMPAPQGAYYNMSFVSLAGTDNPVNDHPQMTLIMSMSCPHCLEVIKFLSKNYPLSQTLRLATTDTDPQTLGKIESFLQQAPQSHNPFKLLKEIKESSTIEVKPARKGLEAKAKNSLNFLSNIGSTSIPVLISEQTNNEKRIIIGSSEIISFLEKTI